MSSYKFIKKVLGFNILCILIIRGSATLNVLNKCFCNRNEVYVNETCILQETFIAITDSRQLSPEVALETEKIPNINIGDITCPEGTVKGKLNPEAFVLLHDLEGLLNKDNGFLHPREQYCIEHVLEDGNLSWMAHACFNITVPLCCPPKHIYDSVESKCILREDLNFNPKVHESSSSFYEDSNISGNFQNLTCPENQEPLIKHIDETFETALVFHKDGVNLLIDHQLSSLGYSDYCVGQLILNQTQIYYASYCPQTENIPIVRKCCPDGFILDKSKRECVSFYQNKTLLAFHDPVTLLEVPSPENFRLIYGLPDCELVFTDSPSEYLLLLNGFVNIYNNILKPDEYCIEDILHDNDTIETLSLYCIPPTAQVEDPSWVLSVKQICMFISCIFLTATLIVYLSVRELRKQLSSKCLIAEVFSLLLTFVCAVITQSQIGSIRKETCMFLGVFGYIVMLSSFLWLNIICYDYSSSLTKVRISQNSSSERIKRFLFYCLIGYGIPFILGMISLAIDLIPSTPQNWWINKPGFDIICAIYPDKSTMWIYLYSSMVISIILNIYFFTKIALYLKRHHEDTGQRFTSESSATNRKNKDQILYLKLFIVMGITWIAEILSYESKNLGYQSIYYWLILDVINALRGLSIFIIFVCKRNTIQKIKKSWSPMLSKITRKSYNLKSSTKTSETNQADKNERKISNCSLQSLNTNSTLVSNTSTNDNSSMERIENNPNV